MPKKTTRTNIKSKHHALKITILIFGVFVFVVGLTVFLNFKSQQSCANSISCIENLTGQKEDDNQGEYLGKIVNTPEEEDRVYALEDTQFVLGDTTNTLNRRLYVDLSKQRLFAFEGDRLIYDFPVSTGKWWATPTGEFRIWTWLRYTRMAGGSKANGTYYNLPNVPYTMYFANNAITRTRGYGVHGAYWHNNFGQPMSHGCVNMKIEDVEKIYNWSFKNTTIPLVIYGTTPKV